MGAHDLEREPTLLIQADFLAVGSFQPVWPLELDDLAVGRLDGELAAKPGRDVNAEMMITRLILQCITQRNRCDSIRGLRAGGHSQNGDERPGH